MLNTPITPPRVPIIDPRTNLIDRAWYMFFLSLFQSVTTNANVPDVGPDNAGVTERVSELTKALQSTLVGPENAGVIEQINEIAKALQSTLIGPENAAVVEQISELAKQLKAFQIGPTSSGLLEQIAALRNEVQAFYLLPANQTSVTSGVTSVDGSGGATGLTLTGGPITSTGTLTLGGTLAVASGGTGAATLDSAGIVTKTGTQTITGSKTLNSQTNQFTGTNFYTSDGTSSNGYFYENTAFAVIGGVSGVTIAAGAYPGTPLFSGDTNTWRATADNTRALGTGLFRYTVVYATTGTINTSDATEKQQVRELDDAERRTAQRVKSLIRAFKWNEAVESKGDGARIHVGVMAQDVEAAFAAEGLDASKYGLFCRDTWDTLDGQPQTRLGVRYEELLAFVIAAL